MDHPAPVFESDHDRTWFLVRLPVHAARGVPTVQGAEQGPEQVAKPDTPKVTAQVTGHVVQIVAALAGKMSRGQLQQRLGLKDRNHFAAAYLRPAVEAGLIEVSLPDKPRSENQRYRRTDTGEVLAQRTKAKDASV